MNKPEEIRKEIQEHVEMCLQVTGGIPSKTFAESISKSLPVLLDGLGVVIKIKRELPKNHSSARVFLHEAYPIVQQELIEDGYSAWVPLI